MQDKIFVTQSSMPLYEEYIEAIKPLWHTHLLTNMGLYHKQLEEELKKYLEVSELSLMVNGHMSLEMAIQMMRFPDGAEIITTPFTFISTIHAIVRNRLTPIFCDVKVNDGTIDESKIENLISEKTVAIVAVHVYGNVCNIEEIQRIANRYDLKVIYDAAHAFGVKYKGIGIGNFGDASIFSFHATKVFNTIEGGAVTFSEHKYYEKLYNLKNFGIRGEELVIEVGANAKMNEFCAIMGICNLKHIDEILENRKIKYQYYKQKISEIDGICFFDENMDVQRNYAYFPILIEDGYGKSRDELYDLMKKNNIYSRKYFYPLAIEQPCFRNKYRNVENDNAKMLSKKILILPFYEQISKEQMDIIVKLLRKKM